jgi:steroid delta-isomerase-like uncharacterized protein
VVVSEQNVSVIRRYYDELFSRGRVELVPELLAEDYVNHSPGSPDMPRDRSGVAWVVGALREAFPDLSYAIEAQIAAGDEVWTRTTMTGTHRGPLFGLPPTGRAVRVDQVTIERLRDGKIVEHRRLTDDLALMRQLGVVAS